MRPNLDDLLRLLGSVTLSNLLLLLVLALNVDLRRGQDAILHQLQVGERLVSTTYTDVYGMSHTVNSPLQADPVENVRLHKQYLTESFCAMPPANPPDWWHPEDCR
jgi:hypothetical protein